MALIVPETIAALRSRMTSVPSAAMSLTGSIGSSCASWRALAEALAITLFIPPSAMVGPASGCASGCCLALTRKENRKSLAGRFALRDAALS